MKALRQTADLSTYPDLVVVYLGMRVNVLTGIKTLFGFGPRIEGSVAARPDGLLLHENLFYSLFPPHFGMRQYWRDFDSLERWTRAFSVLLTRYLQKAASFPLASDCTVAGVTDTPAPPYTETKL